MRRRVAARHDEEEVNGEREGWCGAVRVQQVVGCRVDVARQLAVDTHRQRLPCSLYI